LVALVFHFVFWIEIDKVDPLLGFGAAVSGVVAWLSTAETGEASLGGACRRCIGAETGSQNSLACMAVDWGKF